jgi:hypothetical protein
MAEMKAMKPRPNGARQIDVGAVEHADGGVRIDDLLQDLQAVPHRSGSAIPFRDHEFVARRQAVEGLPELRATSEALAGRSVLEDLVDPLSLQRLIWRSRSWALVLTRA